VFSAVGGADRIPADNNALDCHASAFVCAFSKPDHDPITNHHAGGFHCFLGDGDRHLIALLPIFAFPASMLSHHNCFYVLRLPPLVERFNPVKIYSHVAPLGLFVLC
jgi:hypothetical protein